MVAYHFYEEYSLGASAQAQEYIDTYCGNKHIDTNKRIFSAS